MAVKEPAAVDKMPAYIEQQKIEWVRFKQFFCKKIKGQELNLKKTMKEKVFYDHKKTYNYLAKKLQTTFLLIARRLQQNCINIGSPL